LLALAHLATNVLRLHHRPVFLRLPYSMSLVTPVDPTLTDHEPNEAGTRGAIIQCSRGHQLPENTHSDMIYVFQVHKTGIAFTQAWLAGLLGFVNEPAPAVEML